jgi:hypothetical protein
MSNSITHAAIEPRDEWSLVRIFACSKEPEPVGGPQIKTQGTLKMEHKPDALIRSQVTISGSLIDTWRSFFRECEYERGWAANEMTHHILQNSPLHKVFPASAVSKYCPRPPLLGS